MWYILLLTPLPWKNRLVRSRLRVSDGHVRLAVEGVELVEGSPIAVVRLGLGCIATLY